MGEVWVVWPSFIYSLLYSPLNFYGHSVESIFLFSQKWSFIHHVSPPLDDTPMKRKILWFLWSNIKVSISVILGMWEAFASAVSWQPLLSQRKQGCRKLFGSLINMEKVLLHSSLSRRTWIAAKWEWGSVGSGKVCPVPFLCDFSQWPFQAMRVC